MLLSFTYVRGKPDFVDFPPLQPLYCTSFCSRGPWPLGVHSKDFGRLQLEEGNNQNTHLPAAVLQKHKDCKIQQSQNHLFLFSFLSFIPSPHSQAQQEGPCTKCWFLFLLLLMCYGCMFLNKANTKRHKSPVLYPSKATRLANGYFQNLRKP